MHRHVAVVRHVFPSRLQAPARHAGGEQPLLTGAALAADETDQAALFDMAASALLVDVDRVQFKLSAARAGLAAGPCLPPCQPRPLDFAHVPRFQCLYTHEYRLWS